MYGIECARKRTRGACRNKRCLTPVVCSELNISHLPQMALLKKIRQMPKVKKVFIASGIRHDLMLKDRTYGLQYLEEIIRHHISGQN